MLKWQNKTKRNMKTRKSQTTADRVQMKKVIWGRLAGFRVDNLFMDRLLNKHGYHTFLQQHAVPSFLLVRALPAT